VTVPFTQNLVSIVFASSNASRDVSLRSTSALDSLELTARNFDMEAACLGLSRVQTERSGVALDGRKQAKDNRLAFCVQGTAFTKMLPRQKNSVLVPTGASQALRGPLKPLAPKGAEGLG
jgi:hypothetical protein